MAKKRHHSSKRHLSKHDRNMDRENLKHAKHKESMHSNSKYDVQGYFDGVRHNQPAFNDRYSNDQDDDRPLYNKFRFSGNEFYAGSEPRRRQEMQDAGYIREDNAAVANLPQNVIMRPYPKTGPYMPEGLDDTIDGVDMQMDEDDAGRRAHFLPKKV